MPIDMDKAIEKAIKKLEKLQKEIPDILKSYFVFASKTVELSELNEEELSLLAIVYLFDELKTRVMNEFPDELVEKLAKQFQIGH